MINIAWSVQRARQGEPTFWATVALTVLLCQIDTLGGGLGFGHASTNLAGTDRRVFSGLRLSKGHNPVESKIPVARFSGMLLQLGEPYEFDGQTHLYRDTRFVYSAGGNVFHHHQDLNKLVRAWRRPETIVVHELYCTAQAKFSDIVLPATTSLEREDIGSASNDGFMIAMRQHIAPFADARDDYAIFSGLAARLEFGETYTEWRSAKAWLQVMYEQSFPRAEAEGIALPAFDDFWQQGVLEFIRPAEPQILLKDFRDEPEAQYQQTVARQWPLHLLSSQPRTCLHSQYDHGSVSRDTKISGLELLWMHPHDAAARGIRDGDVVKVFNTRGALLAGAKLSDAIRPSVVQMSTGAWYDLENTANAQSLDKHGNANILTKDRGSSRMGKGCTVQSFRVGMEKFEGRLPTVTAWEPPVFVTFKQQKQA